MKRRHHHHWTFDYPPTSGDWIERGACRQAPVDVMVPQRWTNTGDPVDPDTYLDAVERAKAWCAICTVATSCRNYGLAISTHVEDHGVYGGLSMEERNEIIGHRAVFLPPTVSLRECGTGAAYQRHFRNGEPACAKCRAWKAADARRRRRTSRNQHTPPSGRTDSGEPSETKRRRRRTRNRQDSQ